MIAKDDEQALDNFIQTKMEYMWSDDYKREICHMIWKEFVEAARSMKSIGKLFPLGSEVDYNNKDHQIVQWLEKSANKLQCPNLHLGMTSSDVEENARLIQMVESRKIIMDLLVEIRQMIMDRYSDSIWVGKTHLMPAGLTNSRYNMWIDCLGFESFRITAKMPAGIVGCWFETPPMVLTALSAMDWEKLGFDSPNPKSSYRQSTNMRCELNYCNMLATLAAGVVKVCGDFRYLCSTGEVHLVDRTASSSDPSKVNPTKFERAQSICYTIHTVQTSVWEVAAHDSLEGTLTRRWCLDHEIASASEKMVKALISLKNGIKSSSRKPTLMPKPEAFPAYQLTTEVVDNGVRRDLAYNELYTSSHLTNQEK